MLKWTKAQKKTICFFAVMLAMAMFSTSFPMGPALHLYELHNFLYMGIILAWGFLVYQRILNPHIRKYLVTETIFMLFLFISRTVRNSVSNVNSPLSEYMWYAYYVSFTTVPLCAFFAALYVGRREKERIPSPLWALWILEIIFVCLILTNSWHGWLFSHVDVRTDEVSYGFLYWVCTVWGVLLSVLSFFIILTRCRIKTARKNWFIPALGSLFGLALMIWYYVEGRSPYIAGVKLYNLQEAFCLTFVLPFECMIQLGILPNNSRYELFFQSTPVYVALLDGDGRAVYESTYYGRMKEKTAEETGNMRRSEKEIQGGKVVWYEDMTAVVGIGEEIARVTEELEEENDLIRQENEIRAERIGYETKNRLYDKIAKAVKEKTIAINELLTSEELREQLLGSDGRWKEALIKATVQGVYVKRMGNLMLIMEESGTISTRELGNSIRESLEYFSLGGRTQDIRETGERLLPAKLILLSFEFYEYIMELAYEQIYSLAVKIDAEGGELLSMELDAGETYGESLDADWKKEELSSFGMKMQITCMDDIWKVSLQNIGKEGRP